MHYQISHPWLRIYIYRSLSPGPPSFSLSLFIPQLQQHRVFYQFSIVAVCLCTMGHWLVKRGGKHRSPSPWPSQHVVLESPYYSRRHTRKIEKKKGAAVIFRCTLYYVCSYREKKERKKRTRNFLAFSLGRVPRFSQRATQYETHHRWIGKQQKIKIKSQ